jgi:hypothetical protein
LRSFWFHRRSSMCQLCQLILHGDDDQIMPIGVSALLSFKIVKVTNAEDLQGCVERYVHNSQRSGERGFARIFQCVRQGLNCESSVSFGINIL